MTANCVDLSNYSLELTAGQAQGLKAAGIQLVIVQAVDPPSPYPPGVTRQQIQACVDAGLTVDAYVWLWFDLDVWDIQHKLSLLEGLPIRQLWLDVEDTAAEKYDQATTEDKVQRAMAECDKIATTGGQRTGIYSGRWFWTNQRYMGNTTSFSARKLWDSNYDFQADAAKGFVSYGGWDHVAIKQYVGTTTYYGVDNVDLDVLSDEEAAKLAQPQTPPDYDAAWQAKKDSVVATAGELLAVADQLLAEANRKNGPRASEIRRLADPEVRSRAEKILA